MHPKVSADEIIRFGEFELALKSGELRKNGWVIRLQPQPFKVLAFLASHAGQTVTRQELQDAVWEEGTFVDFEHGLNFCIKQIRTALGDDAQSPRLVETLPRRGYRFIAEVENVNGSKVKQPPVGERPDASMVGVLRPLDGRRVEGSERSRRSDSTRAGDSAAGREGKRFVAFGEPRSGRCLSERPVPLEQGRSRKRQAKH